ncbi:MAG TPA: pyrroline-5-carboxylate reductase [Candidatus Competibacteraceae bacterium]|nr:pyrroline-5-carboxylate reductase [Candidatus Competibacteraceae bacterium]
MHYSTLAFIGGGNMARSLIGGLINDGYPAERLWVADPGAEHRQQLAGQFGIHTTADNLEALAHAEVVVLAVKPQVIKGVAVQLADAVQQRRPLVLSIAAGVREPDLRRWLGGDLPIVRSMPNTPALVGSGAAALYANPWVSAAQRQQAESILRACGLTVWVEQETLLDAVTALSGSGPAYFFLVMEAMEQAGVALGLEPATARLLTLQTAFGAAKMALESEEGPALLRERVTSPGGTTERAIAVLREAGLEALFGRALSAACERARELGDLLGEQS